MDSWEQLEIYSVKNNIVNCTGGNWKVWTWKELIGFKGENNELRIGKWLNLIVSWI